MTERLPKHIAELDGIRAAAIGLVLITHLFGNPDIMPQVLLSKVPAPLRVIVNHGWLGVDLFFVLSGFLITSILLQAKGNPDYFRTFYIRRALRILPLYYAVLVVLIVAYGYHTYATYWNFALGLSANLATLWHANVPMAAGPMWSLAVEEQFYFFWPLVVFGLSRPALALVAIAIAIIEPIARYVLGVDHLFYPWCRFDGLAIGALVAIWCSGECFTVQRAFDISAVLAAMSVALILAGAPTGGFEAGPLSTAVRISEAALAFGALVALVLAMNGSRATAILRSPPARLIAELSFCVYLVHIPILTLFEAVAHIAYPPLRHLSPGLLVLVRASVVVAGSLVVAAISRRCLELPFLRLKSVLTPPAPRSAAAPVSVQASMVERPAQ